MISAPQDAEAGTGPTHVAATHSATARSADSLDVTLSLHLWNQAAGGRASLINLSENHTFRIDAPRGVTVLRLHRPGYQDAASIQSELDWIAALTRDTDLPLVRPLPGRDGRLIQRVGAGRHAVLFAFESGDEPRHASRALFATLGRFAATAHRHVQSWTPPPGFVRPRWTADTMLAADGLWGDWRLAPGVASVRDVLDRLEARLIERLAHYGTGSDRFGLIHADMRLANLLVEGDRLRLLDFDDCGFGWFVYDLASALSFIETDPAVPELQAAWLAGYHAVRPLSAEDVAIIPAMILLRRMVLLAWIGSHAETDLARSQAPHFASDTAELGRRWLGGS